MIMQPESMDFSTQRFSVIIYGSPGLGKTTLALSAPDPILLDFDRGVSRVNARHRKDTSVCNTYEEVLADINSPAMSQYQTIIIDTGGSFITFLKDWAFRTQKGAQTKSGEWNALKGYGFVKAEFARFTEDIKTRLNKNIIYVFHSVEQSDKDGETQQRLMCEGATKNTVWTPCDFGGYVQMIGRDRVISFTPEQEFFAKGCHGITGKRKIPDLSDPRIPNDFMTRLFDEARQNIAKEAEAFAPIREKYEAAIAMAQDIISGITDASSANVAAGKMKDIEHASTSQVETRSMFRDKVRELGLIFDKDAGLYFDSQESKPETEE